MPTLANVNCNNCGAPFEITLKRYNESIKNNWKFYCTKSCQVAIRKKGKYINCGNPLCEKIFYRSYSSINSSNYCSRGCSNSAHNLSSLRTSKELNIKYCLRPFCYKIIPFGNIYCSIHCQRLHKSRKISDYKKLTLSSISNFFTANHRIPTKREMESTYKIARKAFGRWNRAIEIAGYIPNPVLFSHRHLALDGHICDSLAERIVDDWLFDRGITHETNVSYPGGSRYTVDFKVGDYWIEYLGLINSIDKYKKSFQQKESLAKDYNLKLIKIYPSDLFPLCNLESVLEPVIMYHAKSFVMI